jgi:alpha,alpha-trehalose phosphorylase
VRLKVEIRPDQVVYSITDGLDGHVTLLHDGEPCTVHPDHPVTLPVRRIEPLTDRPRQPVGREPQRIGDHSPGQAIPGSLS